MTEVVIWIPRYLNPSVAYLNGKRWGYIFGQRTEGKEFTLMEVKFVARIEPELVKNT